MKPECVLATPSPRENPGLKASASTACEQGTDSLASCLIIGRDEIQQALAAAETSIVSRQLERRLVDLEQRAVHSENRRRIGSGFKQRPRDVRDWIIRLIRVCERFQHRLPLYRDCRRGAAASPFASVATPRGLSRARPSAMTCCLSQNAGPGNIRHNRAFLP